MATLLLADDSVTIQRVIELTFAGEDIRVITVSDGDSAIKRIDEERPDIVLADVGMPGVDGYQVARHVKQSPASAGARVLLLTGAFEPIDEEEARQTGCDGVLVKPFEPRQLIKTVRDLLAGERTEDLWPADMPRLERAPAPVTEVPFAPPPIPSSVQIVPHAPEPPPAEDGAHVLSVPYGAEGDTDLADALARLEFVDVPGTGAQPAHLELESLDPPIAPRAASSAPSPANQSLANVFSALLAAERKTPNMLTAAAPSPALSEAAVEEVVQKVVRRMTDELVRKIVLETAERLIREEIARIKA
jgi:CheY-like chemotaxis protein